MDIVNFYNNMESGRILRIYTLLLSIIKRKLFLLDKLRSLDISNKNHNNDVCIITKSGKKSRLFYITTALYAIKDVMT